MYNTSISGRDELQLFVLDFSSVRAPCGRFILNNNVKKLKYTLVCIAYVRLYAYIFAFNVIVPS